jgi:5-hydroxyisourate hydrolase
MGMITTHILDVSRGKPASGVPVILEYSADGTVWEELSRAVTNEDGRVMDLVPTGADKGTGIYRLTFDTALYFSAQDRATFYPEVIVTFTIIDAAEHYHVPLLLSPFGYSTYRGS